MLKKTEKIGNTFHKRPTNTLKILSKTIQFLAPPDVIEIQITGNFSDLKTDETSLQQVFQNLITNAIKYNDKPKGSITIVGDCDHKYHYFHISDNGSDIADSNLKKIFKSQTLGKIDRYGNRRTGIGLAQVKNILESFGGNISVASELNIGTSFTVCIPHQRNLLPAV